MSEPGFEPVPPGVCTGVIPITSDRQIRVYYPMSTFFTYYCPALPSRLTVLCFADIEVDTYSVITSATYPIYADILA